MIKYVFMILTVFVMILLVLQIGFFELTKRRLDNTLGHTWYSTLNKPFTYNRAKKMMWLGGLAYIISSIGQPLDTEYFLYLVLFVSMTIVADILVLFITHHYARIRCKSEIGESALLKSQLEKLTSHINYDSSYEISHKDYIEEELYIKYIDSDDHIAFVNGDEGRYMCDVNVDAHVVYDVELNGDIEHIREKVNNDNIRILSLASEERLPFKDEKIDTLINKDIHFNLEETHRVLKPGGYYILNQFGDTHLKEFIEIYNPYGLKIKWNIHLCIEELKKEGWNIIEHVEHFGTVKFYNIHSLHSYFLDTAKEFTDIKKYEQLYLKALSHIAKHGFYEMSTHEFIVIARK